jgi:hypothetical protein
MRASPHGDSVRDSTGIRPFRRNEKKVKSRCQKIVPSHGAGRQERAVKRLRSGLIPTETAAANQDMFVAALGQLVEISGDVRDLLVEIRDLLAEGAEQESQAQEGPGAGIEAVIVETEPEEDFE